MKYDFDGRARALLSSLCRDRAAQCRMQADDVKGEALKKEWAEDATYADQLALTIDAGEIDKEPTSRVDRTRDLKN